jgi:hypothetical protein
VGSLGKLEFAPSKFESNKVQEQLNDLRDDPMRIDGDNNRRLNIVFLRSLAPKHKHKYVFKVLPDNREITRSLKDLYWLRSNLCVEFPYYYVG